MLYCNWVSVLSHFRDNGPQTYGVTTLTFLGHVTSSVTWPIDPPYVISYWCPTVTKPVSLTVFEIFDPQYPWEHPHKHRHTPQMILYSVPCNVLHWTDNKVLYTLKHWHPKFTAFVKLTPRARKTGWRVYCGHRKAVVGGPAGPAMAGPLFLLSL